MPGNGEGRVPRSRHPASATTPRPNGTTDNGGVVIVPDGGDPRAIGELLGAWFDVRMAEVDDLVAEARARVAAVPDQRTLWLLAGEILVRLAAVEHELAELRKAARR